MTIREKRLDAQHLDPKNLKWWSFDPLIKPICNFHKYAKGICHQPVSQEKFFRNLIGRISILALSPVYLFLGISALIGVLFERCIKADLARTNRRKTLEDASYVGRIDIVKGILNLQKHTNECLFLPLKNAGTLGHRKIVKILLQQLNCEVKMDLNSKCAMLLAINFAKLNKHFSIADLIQHKYNLWKLRPSFSEKNLL